jgi:hypothetical protein
MLGGNYGDGCEALVTAAFRGVRKVKYVRDNTWAVSAHDCRYIEQN